MHEIRPYRTKFFRYRDIWKVNDSRLKVYTIGSEGSAENPPSLLASAKAYVEQELPKAKALETSDHALGYVILHPGEMAKWLLIHWWAYEDIALGMMASAAIGTEDFASQDDRHFHACVWEHVVIRHERDAWVEHMMQAEGDPEAYLADRLADGCY